MAVSYSRNGVLDDARDNLKQLGNQVRVVETLKKAPKRLPSMG